MTATVYRLPKTVETDPRAAGLLPQLAALARPLWRDSILDAACLVPGPGVMAAIHDAHQAGFVVRGLESATKRLDEEERGLKLVRGERDTALRISRLVVIANDGAERFYRNVEGLLHRHGPRVAAIRFEIDEVAMGEPLYGPGRVARLLLLEHKNAVASVLLALADQWQRESTG